jgi:ribosomal-protein-alanine N-acetyltransferase
MYKLFEKVPVIEGDRIILKRIEFEDADLLDELSKDSDIYRFLPTYLLEQEIEDKDELIDILYTKCLEEKSSLFLGIYLRDAEDAAGADDAGADAGADVTGTEAAGTGQEPGSEQRPEFCGVIELYDYKDHIHKVSLGCRLLPRYWGKGIATEAVRMIVDHLYAETDIEIVTASTMQENDASNKVMGKCGFEKTTDSKEDDWGFGEDIPTKVWFV